MEVRLLREFNVPGTVATELTATKPRFVAGTFDAVVPVSSTGDTVIGLNWGDGQGTYAAEVGASVDILLPGAGIVEVELGDTVSSLFAEITHDSVGRGVTAGAGSIIHGLAMATGVVGDIIPMLFYGRGTAITGVTASAAELNLLDGSVAGTAVASKALALGANKNVDTLTIADGGLCLGATAVTASAAEINRCCDQSANVEAITSAGALAIDKTESKITGPDSSTYAVTLAAPTEAQVGQLKIITMIATTGTNAVTLDLTNVVGGSQSSSAAFDAAGETLVLLAIRVAATTYKWLVLKEFGVTLS